MPADVGKYMGMGMELGEDWGGLTGGNMGSLRKQLLLKQFGSEESYKNKVKLEFFKGGGGVTRNSLGEIVPVDPDIGYEELGIATKGLLELEKQTFETRSKTGADILSYLEGVRKLAEKTDNPATQRKMMQFMTDTMAKKTFNGMPNPWADMPYNFVEDFDSNKTFEENISQGFMTLLTQVKEGNPQKKLDAMSKIKSLAVTFPNAMETLLGSKGPWTMDKLEEYLLTPDELAESKKIDAQRMKEMEKDIAIKQAERTAEIGLESSKKLIDYRAEIEKPQKFQLIGDTPDGKTVSYDPTTGKKIVDGKEYVGTVKPRTTNPEVVNREANKLRIEFNKLPEVKNYKDIVFRHDVMNQAMLEAKKTNNFVAVDQALITSFNKMTDPTSVVRESEYLRTASDLALMNKIRGKIGKLSQGGAGLTQDDRKALFTMAGKFKLASEQKYKASLHEYKGYLANYGVDPEQYINPSEFEKTIVETRVTKSGKKLVKFSDGSIEEQ